MGGIVDNVSVSEPVDEDGPLLPIGKHRNNWFVDVEFDIELKNGHVIGLAPYDFRDGFLRRKILEALVWFGLKVKRGMSDKDDPPRSVEDLENERRSRMSEHEAK